MKKEKLISLISNSLVVLPSPSNITYFWNFGSILGLCLISQILTGIFLGMHYSSDMEFAFNSVDHIMRDVSGGWMIRILHANGASMFFAALYSHLARGMYYGAYKLTNTWLIGSSLFILTMATAFLGYVLPWGQMSFWGATVITNLFSAIPYAGQDIVYWLWGGFAVSKPTLSRFFSLHFVIPFVIAAFTLIHLLYLHSTGSSNPLGVYSNMDKLQFHPYFSWKDLLGYSVFFCLFFSVCLSAPWILGDPENFINANPLVTPIHIQPEWYFLFAYAVLRSIPNKLGGVVALFASVLILYLFPMMPQYLFISSTFILKKKFLFWALTATWLVLTWIGARPVETPYVQIGQIFTLLYFTLIMMFLGVKKYLKSFKH